MYSLGSGFKNLTLLKSEKKREEKGDWKTSIYGRIRAFQPPFGDWVMKTYIENTKIIILKQITIANLYNILFRLRNCYFSIKKYKPIWLTWFWSNSSEVSKRIIMGVGEECSTIIRFLPFCEKQEAKGRAFLTY